MSRPDAHDVQRILELVRAGMTNQQVAAELRVTTRTLSRWRAKHPALSAEVTAERVEQRRRALKPCGTNAAYVRGCRCDACRAAVAERKAEGARRASRLPLPDSAVHGRATTYVWYGCRCDLCRAAKAEYNRPYSVAYQERQRAARS